MPLFQPRTKMVNGFSNLDDIISFMPVPIKSLQSVPFAASYIFGELEVSKPGAKQGKKKQVRDENDSDEDDDPETISAIARGIAEDLPGYASQGVPGYSSTRQSNSIDDDASEERRIMERDAQSTSTDKKNVDLCQMLESEMSMGLASSNSKVNKAKVTLADLTQYNLELVSGQESDANILRKYLRHERLYMMMKEGSISNNNSLWNYLDHFASDRAQQIERLKGLVEEKDQLEGPTRGKYDTDFLRDYFSDDVE